MSDIAKRLAEPFDPAQVSWRVGPTNQDKSKGMALAYIDARDVMRRLDAVCGPENWQDDYPWSDGKRVVCRIGIKLLRSEPEDPNRQYEWVWKTDGAGDTDTEGEKGALSDAFKRAAVKWGIGRYLYDIDSPWVQIEQRGKSYIIPDSERTRLAGILQRQFPVAPRPRKQQDTRDPFGDAPGAAGKPAGEQKPTPPLSPAVNGKAPPPPDPAREADHARAVKIRDRVRAAIEAAQEPVIVDEIMRVNRVDLEFVLAFHEATYDRLLALAVARGNELRASA